MPLAIWLAVGTLLLSLVVSLVTATWRLGNIETRVSQTLLARIELTEERDSKGRHDLANLFERALTEMRQNLRDTDTRHAALDREAIRKTDLASAEARLIATMAGIEQRITAAVGQIETRREADMEKLERRLAEAVRRGQESD